MTKLRLSLLIFALIVPALACNNSGEEAGNAGYPANEADFGEVADEVGGEESVEGSAGGSDGFFEPADCPFEANANLECGYLTVPENRRLADSPDIELAVAILRAPDGGQEPPIVYLEGGPGGSPLAQFDAAEWDYPFTRNRDLIFVDQRGTGFSSPSLDCPELSDESYDLSQENPEVDCQARLASSGIDLTAYNTSENAADIESLRNALGIEEWDLLGISYGTRLALAVMRDHPAGVRSVILDSPFPPNADTPVDEVLLTYELMRALFAACEVDDYCRESYPNLEAVFLETVANLNENPAENLTGDDLVTTISSFMQDTSLVPLIPLVIYEVSEGYYDTLFEYRVEAAAPGQLFQSEEDLSDSEGMYNSVMCHDEYVFGNYEAVEDAAVGQLPAEVEGGLLQASFEFFQMCDFWGAGRADAQENAAVFSDIPTLILSGEFDTATPPDWAFLTAQTLENAFVFVFPGAGHSLLTTTDCSVDIITEFLDDPTREPDRTCIDSIEWPYFE